MIEQFVPVTVRQIEQCIADAEASPVRDGAVRVQVTTAMVLVRAIEAISEFPEDKIVHPAIRSNIRDMMTHAPHTLAQVRELVEAAGERGETITILPGVRSALARGAHVALLLNRSMPR